MIKLDKINKTENRGGKIYVTCELNSDTQEEVIANGTSGAGVEGLHNDDIIDAFSSCFTAQKDLGILNSSGNWEF